MKTHSIISRLCVALLVLFVSVFFVDLASAKKFKTTKGKIAKKVTSPDIVYLDPSLDNGSGWVHISSSVRPSVFGFLHLRKSKVFLTVYFFKDISDFTCRAYRVKKGTAVGDAVSLPRKALGVGYHRFPVKSKILRSDVRCSKSDSMPLTREEFLLEQKASGEKASLEQKVSSEEVLLEQKTSN